MEFEILENSADFKPSDLDEIMISIGWDTEQNAASVPPHETYRVWRTYDYVAIAKTQGKTLGGAGGVLRPRQLRYELSLLRNSS